MKHKIGYIGKRMSVNAAKAHNSGQFTISQVNATLLRNAGFSYSIAFYKWLCKMRYIDAVAYHHTSVSYQLTKFYDRDSIIYAVQKYDLELLYNIYTHKISFCQLKKKYHIKYIKAKILSSALGGKGGLTITVDLIKYKEYYFLSEDKWIQEGCCDIYIIEAWSSPPKRTEWDNKYCKRIIRRIIKFKDIKDVLYSRKVIDKSHIRKKD